MKYILSILFVACFATVKAQQFNGVVEYNRKVNWVEIVTSMPYLSQEEKDRARLTRGNDKGNGQPFQLFINNGKSVYVEKEEVSEYGYSWRKEKYLVIRDYKNKMIQDQVELLGKTYVIEEDAPRIKWKILNEIKEVAGYLCMKAETIDTVNDRIVHAWFTDQIPVYGGPEGYYGLPGLILALDYNDGEATITATKVTENSEPVELPIPKRIKGKKITQEEFNQKKEEHIADSIEGRKNPYWYMRY
jgi:GLPGLI family protein